MISKEQAHKEILEFEKMIYIAELKALSKISLERPLSDREFARMMALKERWLECVVKTQ